MTRPALALSVDVEDWPQSSWDRSLPVGDYCADNTRHLLDLLAEFPGQRATFFVLGKFAERHTRVVEAIREDGHEIGSHGFGHVEIFRLSPEAFAEDLDRSTEAIVGACGERPRGFRAPDFSIVGESLWALDVLARAGYTYDSSIFPMAKARYGIPEWPRHPTRVTLEGGRSIVELPLTTLVLGGKRLPVSGGGYARLMPGMVLRWALRKAHRQLAGPLVFYCHPYELDPGEFRRLSVPIPWKVRFHQGMGRKRTAAKLRGLLRSFECITLAEAADRRSDLPTTTYEPFVLDPADVDRPPAFEVRQVTPEA